jgi:hypothetical protein
MMTYMGIVEQRINEILQAHTYIQQQKQFDANGVKFESLSGFGTGVAGTFNASGVAPSGKMISMTNVGSIMPQPLGGGGPSFKQQLPSDMITSSMTGHKMKAAFSNVMDDDSKDEDDEEEDNDDDEEDDMKPMGIEEFRARVMGAK